MSSATGLAATLGRLRAVAGLTFLEAVRRKVFLIVIIVGAAIVSSAAFLPAVDPSGRLRLIEIWSVRTVTIFCSLGAIFLAGFSLPGDFEQRRIYTLVTKPVHKGTLFLGKFLGFVLLMAVFLLIMGTLTLVYLRIIAAATKDFPEARALPRYVPQGLSGPFEDRERGGRGARSDQKQEVEWIFEGLPPGRFPERVPVTAKLDLRRLPGMEFRLEANVAITAVNPKTLEKHEQVVRFQTNRFTTFEIPGAAISDDGRLGIRMRPAEPDLQVAAWPDGLTISGLPVNFELNFMKGMGLILLQSTLVLLATLAASTFVSAPVSILLGICLFLTGSSWSFVTESLEDVDRQLRDQERRERQGAPARGPDEVPPWLLRASGALSRGILKAVPDFDKYNFGEWLLTDTAVSGRDAGRALAAFAPRGAVLLLLGLLLISIRDFAT
ncbi:MAG TPA: hypothetical protein VGK61_10960 [Planctomycetota bacterium]|jgi:hypothetical protein